MNNQSKSSISRLVVLGALLLLAATASGCGVGLPTQPDLDQTVVNERSADAAGGWLLLGDIGQDGNSTSDGSGSFVPDPEIVVPDVGSRPGSGAGGWARGHQKNKWQDRY